jgi:hypothetical protein
MGSHALQATVSGSFRKAMVGVQDAVYELTDRGVVVLSPADPRVVDQIGTFLFVASDHLRVVKPVQSRHLGAISASDLLWLVAPDGYVGLSAGMEIGYATAMGTPVFAAEAPADITLREYVEVVPDIKSALAIVSAAPRPKAQSVLLDPIGVIETAHAALDAVAKELTREGREGDQLRAVAQRLDREVVSPLR